MTYPDLNELGGYAIHTSDDEQYVWKVGVDEEGSERILEDL